MYCVFYRKNQGVDHGCSVTVFDFGGCAPPSFSRRRTIVLAVGAERKSKKLIFFNEKIRSEESKSPPPAIKATTRGGNIMVECHISTYDDQKTGNTVRYFSVRYTGGGGFQ